MVIAVVARSWWTTPLRRRLTGVAATVAGIVLATGALAPFRGSVSEETAALLLVIPVALGVAIGGIPVAPVGVVGGFVAFDVFFIPPYGTLRVAAGYHWVILIVYGAVSLVVGGVVAQLYQARDVAERREAELRIFYELADVVGRSDGLTAALHAVARLAADLFDLTTVAVLLNEPDGGLRLITTEGEQLAPEEVRMLVDFAAFTTMQPVPATRLMAGGLSTSSGSAGVLAVRPAPTDADRIRLLSVFADQAGVVVERARLAEESAQMTTMAEVDRLRSALMRSVSHDLRTPLASIKASISDLADESIHLDSDDRRTLLSTIEEETDRLTRFVANLLDMSRIESGALRLNRAATPLDELIDGVLTRFAPLLTGDVSRQIPADLPLVDADYTLVDQVVANLVENVIRHCPPGTAVSVTALAGDGWVETRVADNGPGIPPADRERIFGLFALGGAKAGGGTGIGLAICAGVVAAHGEHLWVEQTPGGGSTFVFRLPTAPAATDETEAAPYEDAGRPL